MILFVDIYTRLLYHMSPINITMEIYMEILQKMLKINNYLWTYMRVLQWMSKKSTIRPFQIITFLQSLSFNHYNLQH